MAGNLGDAVLHFKGDTKDLEEKTKSAGDKVSSAMKGIAGTMTGVFATATATATAMLGKMVKSAVSSYADLEQNIGGVETLFKQSADRVIENSKKAYKTAGISANAYMETVTSFSASLLQSLGNDTEKATDMADQAIIDMSDNANKMGTDMAMIQSAYQAFAKQNFTLLDNLKLGYGGTRGEMERLIADANAVKEANGEMADLTIDSFADITEAIHIIQTEMGITGTTAKEAEATITGSVNAMKGAFDNFLNGSGGVEELVDSIVTVVGNVSDAIIKLAPNLIDGIVKLVNALLPKIPELVRKLLPAMLEGIKQITQGLIQNLPNIIQTLIDCIVDIVEALAEALPDIIPDLVDAIIEGILTLLDNIDVLIEAGLKLVMGLITGIINAIPKIIEAIPRIIEALIDGLIEGIPKIIEMAPQIIIGIVTGLVTALGKIFEVGAEIISNLWDGITSMFGQLWEWIKSVPEKILGWIWDGLKGIANIGRDLIEGLWNGIKDCAGWLWDKISGFFGDIWDGICDFFGIGSPSKLFEEGLGKWIPAGFAVGIEGNLEPLQNAIDDMDDIVLSSFDMQPELSGQMSSSYSPNTIVNVQNNMEIDPLGQLVNNVKTFSGGAKNDYNWGAGV